MGSINQIKSKLLELEGGKFQRLCDDWLHRKGYENINPIGMMSTTDRVVKGTPDSLFLQPDGKYVFSEYTVQQNALAKKLKDDIGKCFDEVKTGISSEQISEIIICYLGTLSTHEINQLRAMCQARNVKLILNGLDTLALSIQNSYPTLSESYLDLPLDTGQLLTIEDFIVRYAKNNLTTSIDNKILFQDELLNSAKAKLETAKFLLITGAAGVGKTLFSVNLAKELKNQNPRLKVICIYDKGADLIRDITAYLSEPGDYLIFVDDANRLDNRLDYLLHYLHENDSQKTFRIIATVRDYARESVYTKVKLYTELHEQVIQPLSDNQIKLLTETLFGIKNGKFQERIQEIACGNARLAVMASKVAVETNQIESIQNVTSLYDDYFGQNENVKEVIENEVLIATACAISFFRKVDKLNEFHMKWVENSFGIQPEAFWELVGVLHKNEMVDLYENEVVRISDQVLSTYLFYIAVFEKKVISFSEIVNSFYPDFKKTIVDRVNPILSAFDHKKLVADIRNEVLGIFDKISALGNLEQSIEFLNSFWFALPTESLVFANKVISETSSIEVDWANEIFEESKGAFREPSLIRLLVGFRYYGQDEFKMSFDLLLKYLEKDKSSLGHIIYSLVNTYNFKPDDWRYGYFVQAHIVDTLIDLMDKGKNYLFTRLFILVANAFLKVEHREDRWSRGDTVSIITFRLSPDSCLLPLREKLITNLAGLANVTEYKYQFLEVIKEYVNCLIREGKEMAEADLPFVRDYLVEVLNQEDISHCLIMQDYCMNLEAFEIEFPSKWKNQFSNDTLELSNLLLEDRHERRTLNMGFEEYNQYRHQCLVGYFSNTTHEQFIDFIEHCLVLNQALSGRERNYLLKNGLEASLGALAETAPQIFAAIISSYIEYDDVFEINPHSIITNLFKLLPSNEVWRLINLKDYRWKKLWISTYFAMLPEDSVTQEEAESLLKHLNNTPSNGLRNQLDFLTKYQNIDDNIYSKAIRILVTRSKEDKNFAGPLGYLFNSQSDIFGSWFDVIEPDQELVFDAYLEAFKVDHYRDYSGEALKLLIEKDFNFLYRVVDTIYEVERWPDLHTHMPDFGFLWERATFLNDIEHYAKYVHQKDNKLVRFREGIFSKLFLKANGEVEELTDKKQEFIRTFILKNADDIDHMVFIFNLVKRLNEEIRHELLGLFLQNNNNFEHFQTLDHELTTSIWSGSAVPILEREKNYLVSILPLFDSIDFLDHKAYTEKQIENKTKSDVNPL